MTVRVTNKYVESAVKKNNIFKALQSFRQIIMYKILINAYACCPEMGSEQGMAWNFISRLAAFCELFVITESEYRKRNMEAVTPADEGLNDYGLSKLQCERIHFFFVDAGETVEESERIRRMCWNQGDWRFYKYYAEWQKKAVGVAKEIIRTQEEDGHGIDVMHQLNMAGFREPGMLYLINDERVKLGKRRIPLVWGPMTGFGSIPFAFMRPGGLKFTAFYLIKNVLNVLQLKFHPRVRRMIAVADKLLGCTPEMCEGMRRMHHVEVEHLNETGCKEIAECDDGGRMYEDEKFRIVWVGRFIYTKQLGLALKTVAHLRDLKDMEFHIVGKAFDDAETMRMKGVAAELGIDGCCVWHGQIANRDVQRLMRSGSVFFFTSIFEATSTVVLEAIQNRLPVVCFDRCGFGPLVDESIGRKVECVSPEKAVADFAYVIRTLHDNPELLRRMSRNCEAKQRELGWSRKIERLMEVYEQCIIS